jgi:tetratricopeptide (TPR) repeat protein
MADLARTLLTEEIGTLFQARRSGILAVSSGDVTKALFFRHGAVVFASSTLEKDKLGENLMRLGRISRADFAAAYEASQDRKQRFGKALVKAGVMTEEELGRMVAQQVQRIAVSLFLWTKGDTQFHEDADAIPPDLAVEVSTRRLLFEGSRLFPDVTRLEAALGHLDRALRVSTRPPFDYGQLPFSPAEKAVLEEAADEMLISEMLDRPGQPRPLRARAVYTLLVAGILEEIARQDRDFIHENTGTFKVAVAAVREEPPVTDLREQALRLYEGLPRATHYAVLGVAPDADAGAVDAAYRKLVTDQDRTWRDLKGDNQLSSVLSTLRLRRREAYQILSDPIRREAYDHALGGLSAPGPARTEETAEGHDQVVRLLRQARELLEQGERDAAIPLLLEAVDRDPRARTCRRLLALTLAKHPRLHRTAERHFLAALEQDPHDIELRYRLAGYYRTVGLPTRAMAQLNIVLNEDPRHEKALRDLEAVQAESGLRKRR